MAGQAPDGYVASLTPAHHAELMAIPSRHCTPLSGGPLDGVPVHRLRSVWRSRPRE